MKKRLLIMVLALGIIMVLVACDGNGETRAPEVEDPDIVAETQTEPEQEPELEPEQEVELEPEIEPEQNQDDISSLEIRNLLASFQQYGEYSIADVEEVFGRDAELSSEGSTTNTYNIYFGWGRVALTIENDTNFLRNIRLHPSSYNWFVNPDVSFPADFIELFNDTDVNDMTREWATDLFGAEPYYYAWARADGLDHRRIIWSDGSTWFRHDGMMISAGER